MTVIRDAYQSEKDWIASFYQREWQSEMFHDFDTLNHERQLEGNPRLSPWEYISHMISHVMVAAHENPWTRTIVIVWSEVNVVSKFEIAHTTERIDGEWTRTKEVVVYWSEGEDVPFKKLTYRSRNAAGWN